MKLYRSSSTISQKNNFTHVYDNLSDTTKRIATYKRWFFFFSWFFELKCYIYLTLSYIYLTFYVNIMKVSLKRYQQIRIGIVILISIVISQSLLVENYFIPIITIIIWRLTLFFLRSKVKEIMADERDYALWGKAALLAMQIFSFAAAIMIFVFYAMKATNPSYESIAITLALSVCVLMLTYSCIFAYMNKKTRFDKRFFLIALLLGIAIVGSLRILSWEDNRVCKDGQRIQYGHPDFPMPETTCTTEKK